MSVTMTILSPIRYFDIAPQAPGGGAAGGRKKKKKASLLQQTNIDAAIYFRGDGFVMQYIHQAGTIASIQSHSVFKI